MKALLTFTTATVWSVIAENTLQPARTLTPVGAASQRKDCHIVQCLDPTRFASECIKSVANGCIYDEVVIFNGEVSGADLCVVQGQPVTTNGDLPVLAQDSTLLWPKLDLSLPLADPADQKAYAYVSGEMYFETALTNANATQTVKVFASTSQTCDAAIDTSVSGVSVGSWKKNTNMFDVAKKYPKNFPPTVIDGSQMAIFNSSISVGQAGSITGFYAKNYTISMTHTFNGAAPIEYKVGSQTIQNAQGSCLNSATCTDKTTLEGIYDCITAAADECDLTATYSITDIVTPARDYCSSTDNLSHVFLNSLLPEDAHVTQTTGTVTLTVGSLPAETCNIEVRGYKDLDIAIGECGLDSDPAAEAMVQVTTGQLSPTTKSLTLTSLPDGIKYIAVVSDKDWAYCGGGISSLSATNLSAAISYVKEGPDSSTTSSTAAPSITVPEDPFDTPATSGVMKTTSLAAMPVLVTLLSL